MSRYAAGQFIWVFVVVTVGTIKACRLIVDQIDDATSRLTGLT